MCKEALWEFIYLKKKISYQIGVNEAETLHFAKLPR